jgi:hypothetical protein
MEEGETAVQAAIRAPRDSRVARLAAGDPGGAATHPKAVQ